MANVKSEIYINNLNLNKFDNFHFQNNIKTIQRKPIFAPILEEPIISNIQELNTSSIPMANINNNSSFENSLNAINIVDYKTMNKFRPTLNLSCLPPVFEIPKFQSSNKINLNLLNIAKNQNVNNNSIEQKNIQLLIGSKLNIKHIVNNQNAKIINSKNEENSNNSKSNYISLPPINNHTKYSKTNNYKNKNNENNMHKNYNTKEVDSLRPQKKKLRPIQKIRSFNQGSYNNIHKIKQTIDYSDKEDNKIKFDYNFTKKNLQRAERPKEEIILRSKEINNISLNHNKNYFDKNIIIINNKVPNDNQINLDMKIFNGNINDYFPINRNKSRVINIPSLKIYDRFDFMINNYSNYEKYIKNCIQMSKGMLPIKNILENNDKNYYQIIIERPKDGTLGDLIKSIGSINHNIIRLISKKIFPLIKAYNKIFDYRINEPNEQLFNYLDMDYICFNGNNKIILYPGKLKESQKNNQNIIVFLHKLYKFENETVIKEKNEENKNLQLNIDLMNFGITLINININVLNATVDDLIELISKDYNFNEKCCLFHLFQNNIKIFSNYYKSLIESSEINENYIDFLHNLTSFNNNENNYEKILNCSFLKSPSSPEDNLSNLNELIQIGKTYDFSNEYYTSNANIVSFDLISSYIKKRLVNHVNNLQLYNIKDVKTLLNMNNVDIEELCRELRVNIEELKDKLIIAYENLLRNNN